MDRQMDRRVVGWMDVDGVGKSLENIWYSGLFPLQTAILYLQGVSPETPRICGHVSWAYQTPPLQDSKHTEQNLND